MGLRIGGRRVVVIAAAIGTLAIGLPAPAAASTVKSLLAGHTVSGAPIPCPPQKDGVLVCTGNIAATSGSPDRRLQSFDGQPLALYVILPPGASTGQEYPLIVENHGWASQAGGPTNSLFNGPTADALAQQGYAVLQLTSRGWGHSCGQSTPATGQAACALRPGSTVGYIHLDDERYEARDVQNAIGLLVDEQIVDPNRIGVTGESYGGGVSLELATLNDRVVYPDGSLRPWTSPAGTPLHIAAAAPVIPWTDLLYSLMPNGRTLDSTVTSATDDLAPIGVEKQGLWSGLITSGQQKGTYNSADPEADIPDWYAAMNGGEPYESNALLPTIVTELARYRSPYYLLAGAYAPTSEMPAPLLIANGFPDDLFPVDEALRYLNLERALYPNAPIGLIDGDFGHARAMNWSGDRKFVSSAINSFFAYYLKGTGAPPQLGVTAFVTACPKGTPSGGPYWASAWAALHPGEVDYASVPPQTILSSVSDPNASTIDASACQTEPGTDQGPGVATYRLPAVTGDGYTLLGAPTITADLEEVGEYGFVAARLWDVNPSTNRQTLVARGLFRLDPMNPSGVQTFQLHPGAWHFAAGDIPKLELLGQDSPYARTSNGTFSIAVSNLTLQLPVHEATGSATTAAVRRFVNAF